MVRKLKHHEQKLLKKVDFYEKNRRVSEVMHRYHIQRREDYTKYNRLCGQSRSIEEDGLLLLGISTAAYLF